jgi:hypothetical protein
MLLKVNAAKVAVAAAEQKARETKNNQSLSNTAKIGAETIANGLKTALARLNTVNIDDFDVALQKVL